MGTLTSSCAIKKLNILSSYFRIEKNPHLLERLLLWNKNNKGLCPFLTFSVIVDKKILGNVKLILSYS